MSKRVFALLLLPLLLPLLGFASAGLGDPVPRSPETAVILAMQDALRRGDKAWFADHLHLPVRYFGKENRTIASKAWFIDHYASLIGPELKANILAQDPENFFSNYQGLMVGDGGRNIWLQDFGDEDDPDYEIITINNSK